MEIIKREYICTDFKFDGDLKHGKGGYPELEIGFAIQDAQKKQPKLDVVHKFSYNNFDASVVFVVRCFTQVDFHLAKPDETEIWDEIKLQAIDVAKLLIQECTQIKKHRYPPYPDIETTKEKILTIIRAEINELYGYPD